MDDRERNPYSPPPEPASDEPQRPAKPSVDPSIEHEPHVLGYFVPPDDAQELADRRLARERLDPEGDNQVEHTVWDEPALAAELTGPAPDDQLTYARWFDKRRAATTAEQTWLTTLMVAAAAGPWGVLGALMTQQGAGGSVGMGGFMAAAVLAPVTEEITKVAAALWVVEKRPFWFRSAGQIIACAIAGGLVFAAIENVIYLTVYNPAGGPGYAAWRWTICTALHVSCSTIAGVGLARIWRHTHATRRRPELSIGMPWFATAMVLHGAYNATVVLAEATGLLSF